MIRPSPQEVHIDGPLTDISIKHHNAAFVAETLFPTVSVKKQSDKYYIQGKEHFKYVNTRRAPGTRSRTIYHTYDTGSYFCECHAISEVIPQEVKDNADTPISPEIEATENCTDVIGLYKEVKVKGLLDSNIIGDAVVNAGTAWGTNGSTFDKDILGRIKYIHSKCFQQPNTIIIPYEVACVLTYDPTIKDMVKYVQNLLTIDSELLIPNKLYGMTVKVAGAGYNAANLGQEVDLSYIWGDSVYLAFVNPSPGLRRISLGYIFQWQTRLVRKIELQWERATVIEVMEYTDEKIIVPECGAIIAHTLG